MGSSTCKGLQISHLDFCLILYINIYWQCTEVAAQLLIWNIKSEVLLFHDYDIYMGHIALEEYYAQSCPFFLQSLDNQTLEA